MPPRNRSRLLHAIIGMVFLFAIATQAAVPTVARAEGSRSWIAEGGSRAYLEYHNSATTGNIPRKTIFYVYAKNTETLNLGSSATGVGTSGDILAYPPDNTSAVSCKAGQGGNPDYGLIDDLSEEQAGPLPNAGGYDPCVINVDAAKTGVWEVHFVSPAPTSSIGQNPLVSPIGSTWVQSATVFWVNAWDITVRDTGGSEITGRTYAKHLAFNLGNNSQALNAVFHILTRDGYIYKVDMNGIDPFGFIFFANTEGFTDLSGKPIYRSVQFAGNNSLQTLPGAFNLHLPTQPDDTTANNITHKIFLAEPAADLPASAPSRGGTEWLKIVPTSPSSISNFEFVGVEGTPGAMGTNPLAGNFIFDSTRVGGISIRIDVDKNGTAGDSAIDRIIYGSAVIGTNKIFWDGLDGQGNPVPPSTIAYKVDIVTFFGEVHFPFFDAERNQNGFIIERRLDSTGVPATAERFNIYYDTRYNYTGNNVYDYSLCAGSYTSGPTTFPIETPSAPSSAGITEPAGSCYGTPPNPRAALNGTNSSTGAHRWRNGFGDRRGIDTWVYYPSAPEVLPGGISVREADLAIVKTHTPANVAQGEEVEYKLRVTNNGPIPVRNATVIDNIPATITGVTWSCAVATGSFPNDVCGDETGFGNLIDTTISLTPTSVIEFTVRGTISPDATGTIVNTAVVNRPPDVTEPNLTNNKSTDIINLPVKMDLELGKFVADPPPSGAGVVTFTITLRNRGPGDATNIIVEDRAPAGLTIIDGWPSRGTFDPATARWSIPILRKDEFITMRLRANWNGTAVTNVAEVISATEDDIDSTPGNNITTEDDQASAALPIQIADVALSKTVDQANVNVGDVVEFTIVTRNQGPSPATGVVVADRIPSGLSLISASATKGSFSLANNDWTIGNLAVNEAVTLTLQAQVLEPGTFRNVAEVSAMDQRDADSTPNNNDADEDDQASAAVTAALIDLSLIKIANIGKPLDSPINIGDLITYTVRLRNDGPSPATGVEVADNFPAQLQFISASPDRGSYNPASGIWTIGNVAVGESLDLQIVARVLKADAVTNTAQVTEANERDKDSTPNNNDPREDDQSSVRLPNAIFDLELDKQITASNLKLGGVVEYQLKLYNNSPITGTNVIVTDQLPNGLIYLSSTATRGEYEPRSGEWFVGTVYPTETLYLTMTVQINATGTSLVNMAQVAKADQFDRDSTPGNGVAGEDDQDEVAVTAPASVSLLRFGASRVGTGVELTWATGSEVGLSGFHLYRSSNGNRAAAVRITASPVRASGSLSGAAYRFVDRTAISGVRYVYWLSENTTSGARLSDAVEVTASNLRFRVTIPMVR